MSTPSINYKRHPFQPEIIAHAVWLYCRFNLSFREVEEMFLKRGLKNRNHFVSIDFLQVRIQYLFATR